MTAGYTCRAALAVVLAAAFASPAGAQYFGRNKVQYKTFDFQVLRTEHFDIYFYPEERLAVQQASLMAERWYARLSRVLGHQMGDRQPLILYASHPEFEQTNAIQGELGEGTGGVTEMIKRRIVLPLGISLAESDHVIGHELVHAFQFDITSSGQRGATAGALRLPLWFIEGMAEYLSIGPVDPHTAMWMRDAASQEQIPAVKDLDDPRVFPVSLGPGVLDLRDWPVGRPRGGLHAPDGGRDGGRRTGDHQRSGSVGGRTLDPVARRAAPTGRARQAADSAAVRVGARPPARRE